MKNKSTIFALLSVLTWSTVATAFKISLEYISPELMLLIATYSSFLIFLIINLFGKSKIKISEIKIKNISNSAIYGLLNPFLYYLVLFEAYNRLQAQIAQSLNYSWGLVLGILSILFLKQKISLLNILALMLSFVGVIIISTKGDSYTLNFDDPIGISLAVGSSLIWAIYWLLNIKDKRKENEKMLFNFLFGSIYITIYYLIFGESDYNINGLLASIYVGAFEMGVTFLLWMNALKYSENTAKTSNIIYLSPFISLIYISIILKEQIYVSTIYGLFLIISGIILQNITKIKKNTKI